MPNANINCKNFFLFIYFLINIILALTNDSNEILRTVLTARRTKVRVLYHEQHNQTKKDQFLLFKNLKQENINLLNNADESLPSKICLTNKRGRLTAQIHSFIKTPNNERPSLNFDKMRKVIYLFFLY